MPDIQPRYDFNMEECLRSQFAARGLRTDAAETAAFSRELEYVHSEVINAKYASFKWRDCIPIKGGIADGITSHRWYELDGFGEGKFLDGMGADDFPVVEIQGAENTEKIRSIGAKYSISVVEMRTKALLRVNVETEKAKLARRGIESQLDKAVWGAHSSKIGGFKGLIHNDNSTLYTPDATYGSNGSWGAATSPGKIIYDIRKIIDTAFVATKGEFDAFDLFLPPELSVQLSAPMSFTDGGNVRYTNQTIAKYALENIERLRSIKGDCNRLTGAGTSGASYHRALCYPRDPEVLDVVVPLEFEQSAPQLSGMSFDTFCRATFGGVRIKHKVAVQRMDLTV